jgi:hypothetical protein
MKLDDGIDTITKFFNDLIGALVPGLVLAIGLAAMHGGPGHIQFVGELGEGAATAFTVTGVLFALGHLLLAIHEVAVKPLLRKLKITRAFDEQKASARQSCVMFNELITTGSNSSKPLWDYRDLRSVALSVSDEAASLGRRFMFISLLCNGVGTALLLVGLNYLICLRFFPGLLFIYDQAAPWWLQAVLLFSAACFLFKQADLFYERAMTTPFSVAVAELKFKRNHNASNP